MIARDIAALRLAGQREFKARLGGQASQTVRTLRAIYLPALEVMLRRARVVRDNGYVATDVTNFQDDVRTRLDGLTPAYNAEARRNEQNGLMAGAALAVDRLEAAGQTPDPILRPVFAGFVDSPAWQDQRRQFGIYFAGAVAGLITTGMAAGRDRYAIGRDVHDFLDKRPYFDMVRGARTVQLWAARAGQREIFRTNRTIVRGWIWSASEDGKTCMGCWAMDGTFHSVEEFLNDHHLGRCAPVPVTPDWSAFGLADGGQGTYGGGEGAFSRMSEDEQIAAMGRARWLAWRDGLFTFSDLSTEYVDPVYGPMRKEAPLEQIVGETLAKAYARRG